MADERIKGSCMCGAVAFTAVPTEMHTHACHCDMCRKWTSCTYLGVNCGTSVEVAEGAPLRFYVSSEWGERGFCSECGSTLFWRLRDGTRTFVSVNSLENAGAYTFETELYIDAKPPTYNFAEPTKKLTRAEVVALFSQEEN